MKTKKANCPICSSKRNTINGNIFRCLMCGYVNTNFKNFIKKRAKNPNMMVLNNIKTIKEIVKQA